MADWNGVPGSNVMTLNLVLNLQSNYLAKLILPPTVVCPKGLQSIASSKYNNWMKPLMQLNKHQFLKQLTSSPLYKRDKNSLCQYRFVHQKVKFLLKQTHIQVLVSITFASCSTSMSHIPGHHAIVSHARRHAEASSHSASLCPRSQCIQDVTMTLSLATSSTAHVSSPHCNSRDYSYCGKAF